MDLRDYIYQIKILYNLLQFFWVKMSRVVIVSIFEIFLSLVRVVFNKFLRMVLVLRQWLPGYFTNWKFVGWNSSGFIEGERLRNKQLKEKDDLIRKDLIKNARRKREWAFLPKEKSRWRRLDVKRFRWLSKLNKIFCFDLLIIIQPNLHYGIMEEAEVIGIPIVSLQLIGNISKIKRNFCLKYIFYTQTIGLDGIIIFLQILRLLLLRIKSNLVRRIKLWL